MAGCSCARWSAPASRSIPSHRARAARLGPDHPRRLRPDRDHRADRQFAGPAASSPARWAGRCPATASRCSTPTASPPTKARSACASIRSAARPDGRLRRQRREDDRARCATATTTPATSPRATRDGYITYVGRADDVFKASDYRISPFELESVLIEHAAVAEAAVVPSPDPMRLAVPKAFVVLAPASSAEPRAAPGRSSRSARAATRALQAHPPDRVRRAAEDHLRQDPPRRAARAGGTAPRRRRAGEPGVFRGRLRGPEGLTARRRLDRFVTHRSAGYELIGWPCAGARPTMARTVWEDAVVTNVNLLDRSLAGAVPPLRSAADVAAFEVHPYADRIAAESTYEALQIGARTPRKPASASSPMPIPTRNRHDGLSSPVPRPRHPVRQPLPPTSASAPATSSACFLPLLPQTFYALFGAQAAGIANPVNPLLSSAQIAEILRAAETKVLVALGPHGGLRHLGEGAAIRSELPDLKAIVVVRGEATNPRRSTASSSCRHLSRPTA